MNWDRVEGQWKQIKGRAKEQWGHLIDDDFDIIAGKRVHREGELQERDGLAQEEHGKMRVLCSGNARDEWFKPSR